jgi:hypothetical protein
VGCFAPSEAQVALWLRLPAGLLAHGPVAPRDAQLPLPLGGDGGDFGGCGPPLRATMLRGAHGTTSSQGSSEWCAVSARQRCLTSPTPTAPRALGCPSTTYKSLSIVFHSISFQPLTEF